MYEFHYDYMKPKYGGNLKLCYMDTDLLVYHSKTEDFYEDITKDVKARFSIRVVITKKMLGHYP